MTVYVDNANIKYKNYRMFHMIADTEEELLEMALKIGLKASYWQYKGTYRSHFDISTNKKKEALKQGAINIDIRMLGKLLAIKKKQLKNS